MTYMEHSGIKGQKKGVRRFQYANKTYTPEGNKRYRPNKTKIAVGAATAAAGTAWLASMGSSIASGIASTGASGASLVLPSITGITSEAVALGAEIVAGFAAIPSPVIALTVSSAIMLMPSIINSGQNYVKDKYDK